MRISFAPNAVVFLLVKDSWIDPLISRNGNISRSCEVFRQCRVSAAFGGHDGHGLFCDHAGRCLYLKQEKAAQMARNMFFVTLSLRLMQIGCGFEDCFVGYLLNIFDTDSDKQF